MSDKQRLNLTVDGDIPAILERLAGGRNNMGAYLSKMVRSIEEGTPEDEIERMDKESLRLMVQGLGGRVKVLEGEVMRIQAQLATFIVDYSV